MHSIDFSFDKDRVITETNTMNSIKYLHCLKDIYKQNTYTALELSVEKVQDKTIFYEEKKKEMLSFHYTENENQRNQYQIYICAP